MGAVCCFYQNIRPMGTNHIGKTTIHELHSKASQPQHICAMEAAAAGDTAKVRLLIQQGLDINVGDRSGRTALHLASSSGHVELVDLLIRSGSNINVRDNDCHEPLQEAIVNGHIQIAEALQKAGAQLSDSARDELKNQLLSMLFVGDTSKIRILAAAGFFAAALKYLQSSMLHIATEQGHEDIIKIITSHKDPDVVITSFKSGIRAATLLGDQDLQRNRLQQPHSKQASFALMEACPPSIAAAMLDGREVPPISTASSSLFYSDIVGFTAISSTLSAEKVSRMLNDLFKRLDRLAYLHGVQKVDVVGDAYIAATNFTEDQPDDHAARLARFAIDAVAAAQAVPVDADDPDRHGRLQVRVGLHCGPVVGIVADRASLKYTLIGETAVTAARMESSGAAGRIQCSAAAARLIAQQADDVMVVPRYSLCLYVSVYLSLSRLSFRSAVFSDTPTLQAAGLGCKQRPCRRCSFYSD